MWVDKFSVKLREVSFHGTKRVVLGHKISRKWIEVDKAKIEVIDKLPPLTSIKGIRSFLGHTELYRRFIKDRFYETIPTIFWELIHFSCYGLCVQINRSCSIANK